MNLSTERKWIIRGFSLATLLTGFSGYASYLNAMQLIESTIKVEHTHTLLTSLTDVISMVLDIETEQRNYILSRNRSELVTYNTSIQNLDTKLRLLRLSVDNNPLQYQQLITLESLITRWRSLIDQMIYPFKEHPSTKQISTDLWRQSQQTRSKIQKLVSVMQTNEEQQMQQWIGLAQSNIARRLAIDLLSTVLSFIVLSSMFVLYNQQVMKRQQAEARQHILAHEKELSELKLQFFSMVSHEFRTPLSLILGSVQLLIEDIQHWSLEKKRNNLERIQSAARLMSRLLTDTLTLTRAEAGKLEFAPTLMDVESFCLNLIEDLQVLNESNYSIQFISSGQYPYACLDENLLYSILSNLLSNSVKYSPNGGIIQFRLDCSSKEIIFQVQDHGIGIPAEIQQHLYEPFNRADNVGTIAGTGLGLAVVKKCVDLHQGQITIESRIEIGTTVIVRLPSNPPN